jgi:hypothetical protein
MVKRARLDLEPPAKYRFLPRFGTRLIANFGDIVNMSRRTFPTVRWELMDSSRYMTDNAMKFNQARFVFSTHGAGLANVLFVQPKTVVCEVESDRALPFFMGLSRIVGLFHVVCRLPKMVHHSPRPTFMPLELAHDVIRAGLTCLGIVK